MHLNQYEDDAILCIMDKINKKLQVFTNNHSALNFSQKNESIYKNKTAGLLSSKSLTSLNVDKNINRQCTVYQKVDAHMSNGIHQDKVKKTQENSQFSLKQFKRISDIKQSNKKMEQTIQNLERKIRKLQKSIKPTSYQLKSASLQKPKKQQNKPIVENSTDKQISNKYSSTHKVESQSIQQKKKSLKKHKCSILKMKSNKHISVNKIQQTQKNSFISQQYLKPILQSEKNISINYKPKNKGCPQKKTKKQFNRQKKNIFKSTQIDKNLTKEKHAK